MSKGGYYGDFHSKQGGQFKLIRCDRCNVPTPYGSIHICDEADLQELPSDISCPKCFKKDKTYSALFECSCGNSWRIGLGWDNHPQHQYRSGKNGDFCECGKPMMDKCHSFQPHRTRKEKMNNTPTQKGEVI